MMVLLLFFVLFFVADVSTAPAAQHPVLVGGGQVLLEAGDAVLQHDLVARDVVGPAVGAHQPVGALRAEQLNVGEEPRQVVGVERFGALHLVADPVETPKAHQLHGWPPSPNAASMTVASESMTVTTSTGVPAIESSALARNVASHCCGRPALAPRTAGSGSTDR